MNRITGLISLLRPVQWVKNLFVFLPLFFGMQLTHWQLLGPTFAAFAAFCLAASGVYCLNDIIDVEADRRHPRKCRRPVASGAVPVPLAWAAMAVCFIGAVALLPLVKGEFGAEAAVIGVYIVINILYCYVLKRVAVLDMMVVALGFVLRLLAGSFASGVELSHWIVMMTYLLALFLAVAKRRDDVAIFESTGKSMRRNIAGYNLAFMNITAGMLAAMTLVCYIMYTIDPDVVARIGSRYLYLTSLWVLGGILRYLQITLVEQRSGSPTKVMVSDGFIQTCVIGWVATFAALLYL
ncbi:MAG: decaprenyl-phosphate phosphoribosyltransferase [Candidatus Amulumruptor caecigallinarius]|nr:decaprenyl-phosphate phosphoribosyltransferase [Candidatus Amulumruptor caecigallinarius]MCM1397145.1 decaprenyl-phosphate phosphoribosyltransferase [Candidatus Amulumruptor caecigallinarius]MCM1453166.1 decaprenyl-phosphate phosphoribosyltransferase [bacterium]